MEKFSNNMESKEVNKIKKPETTLANVLNAARKLNMKVDAGLQECGFQVWIRLNGTVLALPFHYPTLFYIHHPHPALHKVG